MWGFQKSVFYFFNQGIRVILCILLLNGKFPCLNIINANQILIRINNMKVSF